MPTRLDKEKMGNIWFIRSPSWKKGTHLEWLVAEKHGPALTSVRMAVAQEGSKKSDKECDSVI